ncbi:MAG: hypothetical protein LBD17_02065, partial [Endomicrobium sp.]|nr:hypothetical protein [Endomicrobium sp.]
MLNNLNTQNQNTNTGSTAATFPPPIGTKINREEEISVAIEKLGINNPKQELNNLITQLNKADSNGTLLKDYTEDYTIQKVKRKIANDYKPEKISNALNEMNNMNNNYIKDIKKQIEDILDLIYTDVAEKYIKKQTGILKEEINKDIVNNKNNEVNLSGVKFSHTFTGYFVEKQGVKFFLDKETQESLSDKIVKNDEKTVAKEAISIYDKDLIKNLKSTNTKHATIKSLREFIHARSGKLFLEHNNNQIGIDQCNNLLDQSLVEALNNVKHYFIHKDISAEEV